MEKRRGRPTLHRLSDMDETAGTATCSLCGRVRMRRKKTVGGYSWTCRKSSKGAWAPTPEQRQARRRRETYRLSDAEYAIMAQAQGGRCLICRDSAPLVIDHCHETGAVRGLLCHRCNVALGWMKDNAHNLQRAARYLKRNVA